MTTTRATDFIKSLQDHGINLDYFGYRKTPMGQYQASVRQGDHLNVLTWSNPEMLHQEMHRLATELGLRDDAPSDVPTCPSCGNRNWMRIVPEAGPDQGKNMLMCLGCTKIIEESV